MNRYWEYRSDEAYGCWSVTMITLCVCLPIAGDRWSVNGESVRVIRAEMGKNITLKKLAPFYARDLHLQSQGFSSLRISSSGVYALFLALQNPYSLRITFRTFSFPRERTVAEFVAVRNFSQSRPHSSIRWCTSCRVASNVYVESSVP